MFSATGGASVRYCSRRSVAVFSTTHGKERHSCVARRGSATVSRILNGRCHETLDNL
jgi:hypothetical protein